MSLLLETQISADADTRKKSEPGPIRPTETAHIITSDAEAIEIAERLAERFSTGASDRDHFRRWPAEELDLFSQSGLWSINVPKKFGGPELSYATVARVTAIISGADPSLGQLPQNHLGIIAAINTTSEETQKRLLFGEVLRGARFGNAFSEFGSKRAAEFETKFTDAGDHVVVNGRKFYSTGAPISFPLWPSMTKNAPGMLSLTATPPAFQ